MKITVTEISKEGASTATPLRTTSYEKRSVPIVFPNGDEELSAELHSMDGREIITWPTLNGGGPRGGLPLPLQIDDCIFWNFENGRLHIKGLLRVPEGTKPVHRTFFIYVAKRFFTNGLLGPYFSGWNDSLARSSALLFNPNYLPLTNWDAVRRCSLRTGHPTAYQRTQFAHQLASITEAFNNALHPCPHVTVDQLRTVMSDDQPWLIFVDKHYEFSDLANRFCAGTAECTTSYRDFKKEWMTIKNGQIRRTPQIFAPKSHRGRPDLRERAKSLGVNLKHIFLY